MAFRILILGGTSDGRRLAERLVADTRYDTLLSFAGRTASLQPPDVPHRVGGFGGVDGLIAFLSAGRFGALVDATHPFAAQISSHAAQAAAVSRTPLVRLECPPWPKRAGDVWIDVADMHDAAESLGRVPRRVFLTVGRLEVSAFGAAPQHEYLIRAVDDFYPPVELPRARILAARGPFDVADETRLLQGEGIDVVVSKNSGTPATYAKIEAARSLKIPVVMVSRPALPLCRVVGTVDETLEWLESVQESPSNARGE